MRRINELIESLRLSKGKLITFHRRSRVEIEFCSMFGKVISAAHYLRSRSLNSGSVVGIIGKNDLEWIVADLACIYCGIKLFPLEASTDNRYLESCQLSGVLLGDDYAFYRDNLEAAGIEVIWLSELMRIEGTGQVAFGPHSFHAEEVISYKSTSGSTGTSKIVGHSVQAIENTIDGVQEMFNHVPTDRILIFLPLNLLQQRYWLYSAIFFEFSVIIVPKEYLFAALKSERPTVLMGVPYIYEMLANDFKSRMSMSDTLSEQFGTFRAMQEDQRSAFPPFLEYLGGNIRYLWTGSAPISNHILEYFFSMLIPVYQGYGTNETCIIAKNSPDKNKIGSVGRIFQNIEVRFDEQGQILVKNQYPVCGEYAFETGGDQTDIFKDDGFFHTGDIGYLDEDGFLFIRDRIKDVLILSNSKKVSPRSIEERIEEHPMIKQCVVYGNDKPYLVAIVVPAFQEQGRDSIQAIIEKYNQDAKEEERLFAFLIDRDGFSQENDFLTNQNKIKRQRIYSLFSADLESLY